MADPKNKPRQTAAAPKKPAVGAPGASKAQAPKLKQQAEKGPEPKAAKELTAADLVDAVDQTLAQTVEGAETAQRASAEATEEVREAVEEPVAAVETAQADAMSASADAAATVAEERARGITQTEQQIEQKGTELMADVMESTRKYTEEAKERFQSAFSEMSEKAKSSVEKSTKALEELGEITKGNVEAFAESTRIASKAIESMGHEAAEYGRVNFEKASAAMKSLAAVKSPAEFFQVQSELLSATFDSFAKESAKQSEALLKLAGDVAQPISTRVSVVTEKVRSLAA